MTYQYVQGGVWTAYKSDYGTDPCFISADELTCRRWAMNNHADGVLFWPFGVEWTESFVYESSYGKEPSQ